MRNVDQIIAAAGGHEAVAARLSLSGWASLKWRHIGIPEKHWPALIDMAPDLTAGELFEANRAARGREAARDPSEAAA